LLNSYSSLVTNEDGSLDLYFSLKRIEDTQAENSLPTPDGAPFSLTLRTYVPKEAVKQGKLFPASVTLLE
jgi:hypothetical protein